MPCPCTYPYEHASKHVCLKWNHVVSTVFRLFGMQAWLLTGLPSILSSRTGHSSFSLMEKFRYERTLLRKDSQKQNNKHFIKPSKYIINAFLFFLCLTLSVTSVGFFYIYIVFFSAVYFDTTNKVIVTPNTFTDKISI